MKQINSSDSPSIIFWIIFAWPLYGGGVCPTIDQFALLSHEQSHLETAARRFLKQLFPDIVVVRVEIVF